MSGCRSLEFLKSRDFRWIGAEMVEKSRALCEEFLCADVCPKPHRPLHLLAEGLRSAFCLRKRVSNADNAERAGGAEAQRAVSILRDIPVVDACYSLSPRLPAGALAKVGERARVRGYQWQGNHTTILFLIHRIPLRNHVLAHGGFRSEANDVFREFPRENRLANRDEVGLQNGEDIQRFRIAESRIELNDFHAVFCDH